MIIINYHSSFQKAYQKRIKFHSQLAKQTKARILLFINDRSNPILKDHQLSGTKKWYKAFSVTGDVRIVYKEISESEVMFIDIGSHNQVY